MEENFSMEWNMEENFSMEWNMERKIFGMEWKKIASMEYEKIIFHSILYHALGTTSNRTKRDFAKIVPKKVIRVYLKENISLVSAKRDD